MRELIAKELPNTLPELEAYVNSKIEEIIKEPNWYVRFKAYEALEAFTRETRATFKSIEDNDDKAQESADKNTSAGMLYLCCLFCLASEVIMPGSILKEFAESDKQEAKKRLLEASEALLQEITDAKDRVKQFGVLPISEKFNKVVEAFESQVRACPFMQKEGELKQAVEAFIKDLREAERDLNKTGELPSFQAKVNEIINRFPEEAKFEVNGTKTWFQKYVMKPFEKFKIKIHALFKSIPERKTFEMYQQELKESADYVPPSPEHKRNNF